MKHVACPVALHPDGAPRRLAAFTHPRTGPHLMHSAAHDSENPATAAARALFDQSGLETTSAIVIGDSADVAEDEHWHFALCRLKPPVRERWQHLSPESHTSDDSHLLRFWWQPLDVAPPDGLDPRSLRALNWIRTTL